MCRGIWTQVGASTYALNHYALAYANGVYTSPANFKMRVTLDGTGRNYDGVFTLAQYLATVTQGDEFDQTVPLVTITGTITATRVTPY